tara:strand:+ start:3665 stop:4234 length:570 start_codon:yes stop_codon:yes gene_type:complete
LDFSKSSFVAIEDIHVVALEDVLEGHHAVLCVCKSAHWKCWEVDLREQLHELVGQRTQEFSNGFVHRTLDGFDDFSAFEDLLDCRTELHGFGFDFEFWFAELRTFDTFFAIWDFHDTASKDLFDTFEGGADENTVAGARHANLDFDLDKVGETDAFVERAGDLFVDACDGTDCFFDRVHLLLDTGECLF